MSRVTDIAEAEANEAEAEDAEAEDETPAPVEDETPAEEPSANVTVEAALAKMEKENARHAAAVERIMGDDFALVFPCTACADFAAGFTFTPPDEAPPLVSSPDYHRCEKCNGYGQVLTGSLAEHGRVQTCLACNGQGFVNAPVAVAVAAPVYGAPPATAAPAGQNDALKNQLIAAGYMVLDPPA